MSNMVYLMTSLPSLTFAQVPPISIGEFNKDAKSQLSARQYMLLNTIDIQKMDSNWNGKKSISSRLIDVRTDLSEVRNAKIQYRQHKLKRLPEAALRGNPLDREKQIMQWQWEELDNIIAGKTFTFTEVLVYKLKLQILSRLHSFDTKKGAEVLVSVVIPSKNEEGKS